ncbi:hypothetical protein ACTFIR_010904 [Dictyostelium discoideum]
MKTLEKTLIAISSFINICNQLYNDEQSKDETYHTRIYSWISKKAKDLKLTLSKDPGNFQNSDDVTKQVIKLRKLTLFIGARGGSPIEPNQLKKKNIFIPIFISIIENPIIIFLIIITELLIKRRNTKKSDQFK